MPNYFNVKNHTYATNRFLPLVPIIPLLFFRSKTEATFSSPITASMAEPTSNANDAATPNSIIQSIGSIFSGSNALDILSSVEPYLSVNSQQLINAIKGFSRSLDSLKAYRTNPVTENKNTYSPNSFNMIKALSTNLNPEIKNSISPILNILSTVKSVQASAPALQQILSPDGLTKTLSTLSSILPNDSNFNTATQTDASDNNAFAGLSDIIKLMTALNLEKSEPVFNASNTKLLEATTEDDDEMKIENNQTNENDIDDSSSLIDMAEKLKEMMNKN